MTTQTARPITLDYNGTIEELWKEKDSLSAQKIRDAAPLLIEILGLLESGALSVVTQSEGKWSVHEWIKKAILLSFRTFPNQLRSNGFPSYDKLSLQFDCWTADFFSEHQVRALPGSLVRQGAYVGKNVVLMPSFLNVGAHVGDGSMIDTWATVGSCAYVGRNCHISGGVGLGGVLEPLQSLPVIIEDNCFIGARSEIVEGVQVGEGAVVGMGVYIGASTPIFDRETGEKTFGRIPPYSVVVAGSLPTRTGKLVQETPHLNCAIIVKKVDEQTRQKTSINELLRP